MTIYDILFNLGAVGKGNGIKQKTLCSLIGCDTTTLKNRIQAERREGALIISDESGYYIAGSRAEVKAFYFVMRAQASSRLETIKPFAALLDIPQGQGELFNEGK